MRTWFWVAYAAFAAFAVHSGWPARPFAFDGRLGPVKLALWLVWAVFLAYSLYCSSRENLIRSLLRIAELHWGRQVGADLYLGLSMALFVVYLHEGPLALLLWLVPTLLFGNLSILLYFAIHFDGLVARFLG